MLRLPCLVLISAFALTIPVPAIVMRHDRDERLFLELAQRFPSVVVVRRVANRGDLGDAGTLVAPRWVLTAAHVAAALAVGDAIDAAGRSYSIDRVIRHPEWQTNADFKFDIALVRLAEPVNDIAPASIYEGADELGMQVTFVGRGGQGTGLTGPIAEDGRARAATNRVDAVDGSLLRFRFDAPGDPNVTDLEGVSGPGDSGGPAFIERAGRPFVIGVSSAQDSRPAGRQQGRYGVLEYYARVSSFAPWIRATMSGASSPGPQRLK